MVLGIYSVIGWNKILLFSIIMLDIFISILFFFVCICSISYKI